ncbi:hypothetical protein [Acidovorax sp. LjRoot194]|uniref:hypothetical protein n=1 Tax=Acidovorax sp. LjRoot194 TaxID=3342280 RepID=UPI003ECF2299
MRYTTEELLLAATVREQAVKLREGTFNAARDKKYSDPTLDWTELVRSQEYSDWRSEWNRTNPLDRYVQKVLIRLDNVANMVKRHQVGR